VSSAHELEKITGRYFAPKRVGWLYTLCKSLIQELVGTLSSKVIVTRRSKLVRDDHRVLSSPSDGGVAMQRTQSSFKRPLTAREAVVRELRRAIAAGELKPGEKIRQGVIAEWLGYSRVPVREALQVLEAEALVTYQPHRGYKVREPSIEEDNELYVIRGLLESEAARRAVPNLDQELLDYLERVLTRMDELSEAGDVGGFKELNEEFHMKIFERCKMPRLFSLIETLWRNSDANRDIFFREATHRERIQEEHRQILDACRSGDSDAVVAAFKKHRDNSIRYLATLAQDHAQQTPIS
jgi:DNA-binding GntR family transcriptional regulator